MAAVKSQGEQFSWLDNSFMSAAGKFVDVSHTVKRNRCSSLPNGQRKMAKLHCVTQKDCVNGSSVSQHQQEPTKCSSARIQISPSNADEDKNTKVINQDCSQSDTIRKLAVDVTDNAHLFSVQDQLPVSLVFVHVC